MTKQTTFTVAANAPVAFIEGLATKVAIIQLDNGSRYPVLMGGEDVAPLVITGAIKDGADSKVAVLSILIACPFLLSEMLNDLDQAGVAPSVRRGRNYVIEAEVDLPEPISLEILNVIYADAIIIGEAGDGMQAVGTVSATLH